MLGGPSNVSRQLFQSPRGLQTDPDNWAQVPCLSCTTVWVTAHEDSRTVIFLDSQPQTWEQPPCRECKGLH